MSDKKPTIESKKVEIDGREFEVTTYNEMPDLDYLEAKYGLPDGSHMDDGLRLMRIMIAYGSTIPMPKKDVH